MKKIFIILIVFTLIFSIVGFGSHAEELNLKDIQNHWAKTYIENLINKGIVNGYKDNTFKPNKEISKAEFTKILISSLGYMNLKDENNWVRPYIEKAEELGILNKSDFTNKEDENINRGKMAEMIGKALGKENEINKDVITIFEDDSNIPQELKGYIDYASRTGILNGYSVDRYFNNPKVPVKVLEFRADKTLTRAETAKVISTMLDVKKNNIKPKDIINASAQEFPATKIVFDTPVFCEGGSKDLDGQLGGDRVDTDELQFKIHGYEWRKLNRAMLPGKNVPQYGLILDIEVINNTDKKYEMPNYEKRQKLGYIPAFRFSSHFKTTKSDFGTKYLANDIFVEYQEHQTENNSPEVNALNRPIPPKSSIRGKQIFNLVGYDIICKKNRLTTFMDTGNPQLGIDIPQIKPLDNSNYVDDYPLYYEPRDY
ncbi:MAG: S-layer homology domain-containing protein [Peptostreptococcaceae bacterium]|jgi:hypothetical protein|nr:S-layer homology domain-containing protein [Peptostreptococcaceae bacterium]